MQLFWNLWGTKKQLYVDFMKQQLFQQSFFSQQAGFCVFFGDILYIFVQLIFKIVLQKTQFIFMVLGNQDMIVLTQKQIFIVSIRNWLFVYKYQQLLVVKQTQIFIID
eukprot:TRINITY_DN5271_c0_g4_i1.p4 TRINITY_DN5271_c0_g4~~TRINITY_DN5271_c0_g4_i1.p4  ORF type:complete len:108 (-),score=1.44 TRINITY_DN5271_c0_g4_i1:10-333(-)